MIDIQQAANQPVADEYRRTGETQEGTDQREEEMTLTTDPGTTERPHFPTWRQVPEGVYATKTQLKGMDLPREPGPCGGECRGLRRARSPHHPHPLPRR